MTSSPDVSTALRELEAARARVERDAQRVHDETREQLVAQLLPLADNLDRALQASTTRGEPSALREGVELVRAQLAAVLRGYGATRIDALGAAFDPLHHEAVAVVPVRDPARHARVLDEVATGYRIGGKLLRPARVAVGQLVA